jgi:hypothetical protein
LWLGQYKPSPVLFFFFFYIYIYFWKLWFFHQFFYVISTNNGMYFYILKIPGFQKKKLLFSCIRPSFSKLKFFFIQQRKQKNIYVILACILALITSLLKSWELGQYFKKSKKNIFVLF